MSVSLLCLSWDLWIRLASWIAWTNTDLSVFAFVVHLSCPVRLNLCQGFRKLEPHSLALMGEVLNLDV